MAHHPQVQNKLCNIIAKQLPPGKLPALKDRQKLPYVEAVIMEVLRFSAIGPVGVLHEATEDVKFHGYLIPKGTLVIANLYAMPHNTDVWGDPEKFRPERFLNEAGELDIVNHQPLTAFSVGRRVCPGDSLARNELFLFTIRLFQSFKVEFDSNEPFPRLGYINGMALSPISHKVIFSNR